ncbi:concanavalin A-like lectin/glucanase domain-containing protein [Neurospora hispaniola]|uniref:Concanavalin A-like lectin/glucanase domain-containing protein n=1 Tax=Neurospora hispaniola TaxID=588809 RepID=A0AAJ0MNV5_9PEZI|nr:concanavalin A-like lectin/glucanase domain-containing protein [Neurospora hispaniola]
MRFDPSILLLPFLPSLVSAWHPPTLQGYNLVWYDEFEGSPQTLPSASRWNIINGKLNVNNELETYTSSTKTIHVSGGHTLQIIPWRQQNGNGDWISGRIESTYTFTPPAGKKTVAQAEIRFGSNPTNTKAGIWPAFWLLGQELRSGGSWPACGELDILETVNGDLRGYGTLHCGTYPGGPCNEPSGRGASTAIPNQDWHTWKIEWDRTSGDWWTSKITWYMDGVKFHEVSGQSLGDSAIFDKISNKPLFFILNVAVGGNWPGYPNANTLDGPGSMMEVGYVAHYVSN